MLFIKYKSYIVVDLVGGGSVINRVYFYRLYSKPLLSGWLDQEHLSTGAGV